MELFQIKNEQRQVFIGRRTNCAVQRANFDENRKYGSVWVIKQAM